MVDCSIPGGYMNAKSIVKWVKIGDTQPTNKAGVHFIRVGMEVEKVHAVWREARFQVKSVKNWVF